MTQTIRDAPGDPILELTWPGEENMPEPMINPTISDNPLRYVSVLCFSSDPPPNPPFGRAAEVGAPMGAYPPPPAVELSGNKLAEKSNADDTEYDRPSRPAGFALSKGSSCSRDSRRDDEMLGREDTSVTASSLAGLSWPGMQAQGSPACAAPARRVPLRRCASSPFVATCGPQSTVRSVPMRRRRI